jgi:3-phenylpropionate/trans-cinnamate dioxygenase ferredoxin reductase component
MAGAKAAETLRSDGFEGRVVLIGAESTPPYSRPGLSKGYLRGERDLESMLVHPQNFYAANDIELLLSKRVTRLSPTTAEVETDSDGWLRYDALLLATGARPRRMNVPGSDLDGIHYLRTIGDSQRLRYELRSASRVAVVGAGWIGSEVAASARQLGVEVALLDPRANPLEKVLGPQVGSVFRRLHLDHGVEFHSKARVDSFIGEDFVEGVRTTAGEIVGADLVVVGIGVTPRSELAAAAGLRLQDGVEVDRLLQSSVPWTFAAGDVASAWHPVFNQRLRVEHWASAREQGTYAARNMLGQKISYDRIPHFASDQYDLRIEYAGHALHWDEVVFRGDPATGPFLAFWMSDERVRAGMSGNIPGTRDDIESLIRYGRPIAVDQLANPHIPLDQIAERTRHDELASTLR